MNIKELYVDSIQFSYKNKLNLISGANLHCKVGDVIAIFGKNGCGKSTLLKIVFGSLDASHSYIRVNGKKVNRAFLTRKVGYLPQESFLPSHEKVSKLIKLFIGDKNVNVLILDDPRIQKIKNNKIYELSGGELRYLEIWLLICQPTDFLLLDEPFTGVEPMYINLISDLIEQFRCKKGFIITDHNYHYLLEIATQITLLNDGVSIQINDKKELEQFYVPNGTFEE
jgi:ABC-type multidrug transport system ATPase subunit